MFRKLLKYWTNRTQTFFCLFYLSYGLCTHSPRYFCLFVCFVLFCFVICFVLFCFVSFRFVSFRFVSFRFVSFRFVCFVLFRFISFRFVSFRFVLFYFISFFVLFFSVFRTKWMRHENDTKLKNLTFDLNLILRQRGPIKFASAFAS